MTCLRETAGSMKTVEFGSGLFEQFGSLGSDCGPEGIHRVEALVVIDHLGRPAATGQ